MSGVVMATAASAAPRPRSVDYPASVAPSVVAAWLSANTSIRPSQVASLGDRYVLAVMKASQAETDSAPGVSAIARVEALTPAFGTELGGRSARMSLDVQCGARRARLRRLEVFVHPDLKGGSKVVSRLGDWMEGSKDSYLGDVVSAACDRTYAHAHAPPTSPTSSSGESHPTSTSVTALTKAGSTSKPPRQAAPYPAPPMLAPLMTTSPSDWGESLNVAKAAPPPSFAVPMPVESDRSAVQIAAEATWDRAEADRQAFIARHPAAHAHPVSITAARVRGATVYRVLVQGFADPADAQAACASLRTDGQACFVRPAV